MIEKTIREIEAQIGGAEAVSAERKQELLKLLATLRTEVAELSKTHGEEADSIAALAKVSAHEATRADQNPQSREKSIQGLQSSTVGFEQSHPRLVEIVNAISKTLSDLGI
jgi:Mg2+ and Co2+ transporter CorA